MLLHITAGGAAPLLSDKQSLSMTVMSSGLPDNEALSFPITLDLMVRTSQVNSGL